MTVLGSLDLVICIWFVLVIRDENHRLELMLQSSPIVASDGLNPTSVCVLVWPLDISPVNVAKPRMVLSVVSNLTAPVLVNTFKP